MPRKTMSVDEFKMALDGLQRDARAGLMRTRALYEALTLQPVTDERDR